MLRNIKKESENTKQREKYISKVKSSFSEEPIPNEYLTEGLKDYIVYYPNVPNSQIEFVADIIIPSYKKVIEEIDRVLAEMESEANTIKTKLEAMKNRRRPKRKNIYDIDVYRKYVLLYPIFKDLLINIDQERLKLINARKERLIEAKKLAEYLIDHPRYVIFKDCALLVNWKTVENEFMPNKIMRWKSLQYTLTDLQKQLEFSPVEFPNQETSVSLIKHLIADGLSLSDSVTRYMAYSDEYITFAAFVKSPKSPFKFADEFVENPTDDVIISRIEKLSRKIAEFLEIPVDDTPGFSENSEYSILYSMCTRFIFDEFHVLEMLPKESEIYIEIVAMLHSKKIADIRILENKFTEEILQMTASEFCSSNKYMETALSYFNTLIFQTNPVDIAQIVYQISICLSAALNTITQKADDYTKSFDDMYTMWKILCVGSQLPGIDRVLAAMEKWGNLKSIPPILGNSCLVPRAVVMSLNSN